MVSRISMIFFVFLTLFFLVGCQKTSETDNDVLFDSPVGDSDDLNSDLDDAMPSVEGSVPVRDDEYWNFLEFSVELNCLIFGDEEINLFDDSEWDALARDYGYESLVDAQVIGSQYEDIEVGEDYYLLMEEKCPAVLEFFLSIGEEFS